MNKKYFLRDYFCSVFAEFAEFAILGTLIDIINIPTDVTRYDCYFLYDAIWKRHFIKYLCYKLFSLEAVSCFAL